MHLNTAQSIRIELGFGMDAITTFKGKGAHTRRNPHARKKGPGRVHKQGTKQYS